MLEVSFVGGADGSEKEADKVTSSRAHRVRPSRGTTTASEIYEYAPVEGRLSLGPSHPTFTKRNAMSKATPVTPREEYAFSFGASVGRPSAKKREQSTDLEL